MQITKKVTFIAKVGHVTQLHNLLEAMVRPSREEDGCLKYNIYQIESEPNRFIVIEAWENEDNSVNDDALAIVCTPPIYIKRICESS